MGEQEFLSERFEANRARLRAVAYRMLGSQGEAEDAVQEAWIRLARADTAGVQNLRDWLTTVVARVCLDMLRARKTRREEPIINAEAIAGDDDAERDIQIADRDAAAEDGMSGRPGCGGASPSAGATDQGRLKQLQPVDHVWSRHRRGETPN